ncbi:hypothetical protein EIN_118140 [Entamoeba invadens IP1]|uniref:Uncharacterized protein n=1 Tax=Entamoeba invadens IP1 TaxID=370355 RepID=L7FPW9_ENTIV|nr:hypothetical protein EIN_118140 [Entamoeba invadens IP1]ELP92240.1 hypothetical protein EIN_118140 [Entamoeba invadens IP1]|eukprot:XP_004259011.1 hypothetical protein EIN_118140 [Entamoeba invadens IP1]
MFGFDSDDGYDVLEEDQGPKTNFVEVTMYILWVLFLITSIPSVVVYSMFYPTIKFTLDELSYTIQQNNTFTLSLSSSSESVQGGVYSECVPIRPFLSYLKASINNKSLVIISTHKLITKDKAAISTGGYFNIQKDTRAVPTINKQYLVVGYYDMDQNGYFTITTNYDMTQEEIEDNNLLEVNSTYSVMNWRVGGLLSANRDVEMYDFNESLETFEIVGNAIGQPFVIFGESICFTLNATSHKNVTNFCEDRMFIENTFYVLEESKIPPVIILSYTQYGYIISADSNLEVYSCQFEEYNTVRNDSLQTIKWTTNRSKEVKAIQNVHFKIQQ